MNRGKKILLTGAAIAAVGGAGTAIAGAGDDGSASGPGADKAVAAALKLAPGHANSVERDSENGATWEVEVSRNTGDTVDVRLDQDYGLVVIEGDSEPAADTGS